MHRPTARHPRYLIDYLGDQGISTTRAIVVSTRSRGSSDGLFTSDRRFLRTDSPDDRADGLLDALQVLGAGLPLKLLNNRTQALEAFSLALASTTSPSGASSVTPCDPPRPASGAFPGAPCQRRCEDAGLRRTDIALIRVIEEEPDEPRAPHLASVSWRSKRGPAFRRRPRWNSSSRQRTARELSLRPARTPLRRRASDSAT